MTRRLIATIVCCIAPWASCLPGLRGQPRPPATAEETRTVSTQPEPKLPTPDLERKHEAAKRSPQDFDVVLAYAKELSDYAAASLVDVRCGSACASGPVKHKPASALDGDCRRLIEEALPMLDALMSVQGLSWERMGRWAALKGRLLGLSGRTDDEQTLIDGYALQHPDAVPVIRRRLELLREAGDAKESVAQCNRSRSSLRLAAGQDRLELLIVCVSLHPANKEGRSDPLNFAKYLPRMTRGEKRLYRKHMRECCTREPVSAEASPCALLCACAPPTAGKSTGECKKACRGCRKQANARRRACKEYALADRARRPRRHR